MILQCSNCNARYVVPDHAIGAAGRTVRCARCAHSWFEKPITTAAAPDFDAMLGSINAKPKPIPRGSNLPTHVRAKASATLKGTVAAMALAAAALALLITSPSLFGLSPTRTFALTNIALEKKPIESGNAYTISGNIVNNGAKPRAMPTVRVTLVNESGKELQRWELRDPDKMIDDAGQIPFSTGELPVYFPTATRFVVELGNPLELAMRRRPE